MDIVKQVTTFNPELEGKAILVKGYDADYEFKNETLLVHTVNLDHLIAFNKYGDDMKLFIGDMEYIESPNGFSIQVLSPKESDN